jgi:outer membrane protein
MRFAPSSAVILFLLLTGASRAAEAASTLTLEQALASVENVNLNVLLGREQAAQAVELANLRRAAILPLIDASAQQRRSKSANLGSSNNSTGPTNRFDAQLTGSYALLDPQRIAAWRAARVGGEVAQADYRAIVQDVLADVAQTYFAHLRNLRRLDVLDANIARARSLHELARNQLNAGVATQIDVTRAEAQLAVAEQARLQQVTTLFESELVLKRLLDIEPGREVRLENFQVRRVEGGNFIFGEEKTAFEKRADYLAAQKSVEQAKLDVRAATFQRLPSLTLSGQYGLASEEFRDSDKKEAWSGGVGISLPIFDGLQIGADRRLALSRQRSEQMRLHNLELQISSELRLALQDAGSRNAQIEVAEKSVRLAQEELRLAQQRYQQGVADNREVVEAQNRLAIADDNLVEAVYQYNLSRVELARARGDVRTVLVEKLP